MLKYTLRSRVHVQANDVLATSFAAMHVGKVSRRRMRFTIGAGTRLISAPGGIIYIARAYAGQFCRRALAIYGATAKYLRGRRAKSLPCASKNKAQVLPESGPLFLKKFHLE